GLLHQTGACDLRERRLENSERSTTRYANCSRFLGEGSRSIRIPFPGTSPPSTPATAHLYDACRPVRESQRRKGLCPPHCRGSVPVFAPPTQVDVPLLRAKVPGQNAAATLKVWRDRVQGSLLVE